MRREILAFSTNQGTQGTIQGGAGHQSACHVFAALVDAVFAVGNQPRSTLERRGDSIFLVEKVRQKHVGVFGCVRNDHAIVGLAV